MNTIIAMKQEMIMREFIRDLNTPKSDVSEQRRMELDIQTAIQQSRQDYIPMRAKGIARVNELIPQYVKSYGHLGLVKFGYFNG